MKIHHLQGRLNRLHEDSNVPGISTAAMKLVLPELDRLEVKMKAIEEHMEYGNRPEKWSGTITELRAVVRAKLAKDTGVRVAPRASTVRMDAI